jgi:hypothetical protein
MLKVFSLEIDKWCGFLEQSSIDEGSGDDRIEDASEEERKQV